MPLRVPVLIVGGGPVGLSLANELGWRGIPCLLVEQRDGSVSFPKMNMVSARSMEVCRRWGLAERVKGYGWPDDYPNDVMFVTSIVGHELARFSYPSYRDQGELDYTPEPKRRVAQIWFDPILRDAAMSLPPVALRYRTRLEDFTDDGNVVRAGLVDLVTGRPETVEADWLVGCDGDQSAVRDRLGIRMEGSPVISHNMNIFFLSEELARLHDKGWAWAHWIIGPDGQWGNIVAVDGRERWRLSMTGLPEGATLTNEEAGAYIRKAVGRDFAFEVKAALPWTRRQLVAETYGKGRCFIAGDAAHLHSPTGGFGMNTGIGDVVDLGWKLAAAIDGWGGKALLASYDAERRPVGHAVVEEATRNFRMLRGLPKGPEIAADTPDGAALRARVRETILNGGYNREYESDGLILGVRYDPSPIVWPEDGMPPPLDVMVYRATTWPGARAPHAWVAPGRSTLDLFGRGFTLLRFGTPPPDCANVVASAKARGVPLRVHDVDDPAIAALYERRLVLVRPDGHVAWRGDREPERAAAVIDRVCGAASGDTAR